MISVYKATNTVNGKAYIGVTSRGVTRRWGEHSKGYYGRAPSSLLHRAIQKYGREAFTVEILYEAVNAQEALMVERGAIAAHGTFAPAGYNLSTGGEMTIGRKLAAEARQRIADAAKAQWADPEKRARALAAMESRVIPESHKEHLRRLAAEKKGKPHSAEHAANISAALMGHEVTADTLAKMSSGRKGKGLWTDEHKAAHGARVRETQKAHWADPGRRARHIEAIRVGSVKSAATRTGVKRGSYKPRTPEQKAASLALRRSRRLGPATRAVRDLVAALPTEFVERLS